MGLRAYAGGLAEGHRPDSKPPDNEQAVWEIANGEGVEEGVAGTHPTIKPVELVRRPIGWHTPPAASSTSPSRDRHGAHRRRAERSEMLRTRALAGLRRRGRRALGGVHWQAGDPREGQTRLGHSDQPDAPRAGPTIVICRRSSCARPAATYQVIADQLGYAQAKGAYKAVTAALKATLAEPAEELRTLELDAPRRHAARTLAARAER